MFFLVVLTALVGPPSANGQNYTVNSEAIVFLVVVAAVVITTFVVVRIRRMRTTVRANSLVLSSLGALNAQFSPRLPKLGKIELSFSEQVNSKAKFDRYDLHAFALQELAQNEKEIQPAVDLRLKAVTAYEEYTERYDELASQLGESSIDEISAESFKRIEARLFERGKLSAPVCRAGVRFEVGYRSSKGQNSYSKADTLDFNQLIRALDQMRRTREERSTAHFQRQQERNRMTAKLRVDVLRRDGSRCRMCGRTADVVPLHVDHIVPVSKDGKTVLENLQTLCQDCNLGKSNRFSQ